MMNNYDIRNPDLRKLVHEASDKQVDIALLLKVIVVVDSAISVAQRNNSNDNAHALRRIISIEESVKALRLEANHEREARNKNDLERAERDAENARKRLGLDTNSRLEVKKIFEESLRNEVGDVIEDEQERKRLANREYWRKMWNDKIVPTFVTAMVGVVIVPITLGLLYVVLRFMLETIFKVKLP